MYLIVIILNNKFMFNVCLRDLLALYTEREMFCVRVKIGNCAICFDGMFNAQTLFHFLFFLHAVIKKETKDLEFQNPSERKH